METKLNHSESVHGHGKFVASVILIIMDYQRNTLEEILSADVENAIIDRITHAAFGDVTMAGGNELKDTVRTVYHRFRPGTEQAKTMPLFLRPNNILQLAFSIIEAASKLQPPKDATQAQPLGDSQADVKPELQPTDTLQSTDDVPPQPSAPPNSGGPQDGDGEGHGQSTTGRLGTMLGGSRSKRGK